jgi:hypothetical protein
VSKHKKVQEPLLFSNEENITWTLQSTAEEKIAFNFESDNLKTVLYPKRSGEQIEKRQIQVFVKVEKKSFLLTFIVDSGHNAIEEIHSEKDHILFRKRWIT